MKIEEIKKDSCSDLPFQSTSEEYEKAIDFLVSNWKSLPQKPSSIYQIGQVGVPGISDLDFILVFSESKPINWRQYEPSNFPDWIQKLMTHSPYFCLESDWAMLPAWYPVFDMKHLGGKLLSVPSLKEEEKVGSSLGMLIDYLIVKIPVDFLTFSHERPLRIRILLALLHSLKYTARLSQDAGINLPEEMNNLISRIDNLRKKWLKLNEKIRLAKLSELCNAVFEVTGKLITNVDKIIRIEAGDFEPLSANFSANPENKLFQFKSNWDYQEVMEQAVSTLKPSMEAQWINPESFMHILSIYADECPELGKYLKKAGCRTDSEWDGGKWEKGLRLHARAMASYADNLNKLGIPSQKYVAMGYSPPIGRKNSFMEFLKRFIK